MKQLPDFITIGAMKCATSTLHEQLALQPGFLMSRPKEPNFFSNDEIYARGMGWYGSLFRDAREGDLCGESSTHYTKLPTYPRTVERMRLALPRVKLIFVMRHPIDRLVSQYIHEWNEGTMTGTLDEAVDRYPRLIAYSRYSMQLRPYFEAYGPESVLPVFFERITGPARQGELDRIIRFLGREDRLLWDDSLEAQNVSQDRMRKSALRDLIVNAPVLSTIRKTLIPRRWRDRVKAFWMMKQRPRLSDRRVDRLRALFDEDLAGLETWSGFALTCDNFRRVASPAEPGRPNGSSEPGCSPMAR